MMQYVGIATTPRGETRSAAILSRSFEDHDSVRVGPQLMLSAVRAIPNGLIETLNRVGNRLIY